MSARFIVDVIGRCGTEIATRETETWVECLAAAGELAARYRHDVVRVTDTERVDVHTDGLTCEELDEVQCAIDHARVVNPCAFCGWERVASEPYCADCAARRAREIDAKLSRTAREVGCSERELRAALAIPEVKS